MAFKRKRSRSATRYGSRKRARFTRGKRYRARRNRRYVRSFLRYTETKYVQLNTFHELYHNSGGAAGTDPIPDYNILQTQQGVTQFTRIGDKIWAKGLKVKMHISSKSDRPNVMYRIAVITMPPDQVNANPINLWPAGSSGQKMLDTINTDRYKIIYQKIINVQSSPQRWTVDINPLLNRDHESSRYHSFYLKLNRMIGYTQDNGVMPKYQKDILGVMMIPYDATGTLITDNIGSIRTTYRLYFKDP